MFVEGARKKARALQSLREHQKATKAVSDVSAKDEYTILSWRAETSYQAAYAWVKRALSETSLTWCLEVHDEEAPRKVTPQGGKAGAQGMEPSDRKVVLDPRGDIGALAAKSAEQEVALGAPATSHEVGQQDVGSASQWLLLKALRGSTRSRSDPVAAAYSKGRKLGEGTFGTTYLAAPPHRDVVLKCLKSKEWPQYLSEVELLSKLRHPNVVELLDVCTAQELTLVLRYGGVSLRQAMANHVPQRCPFDNWPSLATQLLEGLAYLHSRRVVHTDIKPANLVLHGQHLQIVDLGAAFVEMAGCRPVVQLSSILRSGLQYGTLWFRPIEVLLGDANFSFPMDTWSTGCVVFELTARNTLFPHESVADMLQGVARVLGTPTKANLQYVVSLPLYNPRIWSKNDHPTMKERLGGSVSNSCFHWLLRFLTYQPKTRATAEQQLSSFRQHVVI